MFVLVSERTHECLGAPGPLSGGVRGRTFWPSKMVIFVLDDPTILILAGGFSVKVD